jgi:hypothetical protein
VDNILPGVRHYIWAVTQNGELGSESVVVKSGEVRDLGTIKLKQSEEAPKPVDQPGPDEQPN